MSDRERYWRGVLRDCRSSGLSRAAFCRGRGINYQTLSSWQRRIEAGRSADRRGLSKPAAARAGGGIAGRGLFMELPLARAGVCPAGPAAGAVATGAASPAAHFEILLACGRMVRVPAGFDDGELARVLVVLASEAHAPASPPHADECASAHAERNESPC